MYTSTRSKETQSSVITCPVCGSDTVKRTSRYGSFWGCSRYPGCRGTQPFKIDHAGQPCRHCGTPVLHQTHTKPPKPGRSYFAWWFKCPGCKALYLVEAARRFFDATGTVEPSSSAERFARLAITERAIHLDDSERLRLLTSLVGPPSGPAKATHICSSKLTQAVCS